MSIQIITNYANAITSACGLDINQAKTVVYWAIATHAIDKLQKMPILVIMGPFSSGKSNLISLIGQICYRPRPLDGEISKADLRDKLEENTTVLIEEADKVDEQLILKRYAKQTANTSVKRGSASQGWTPEKLNLFGATVLHRRVPFKDPAVDSRCITIKTIHKLGNYTMPTLNATDLAKIASIVDWYKQIPFPSGRAADTWMPLFQPAIACKDPDWPWYAANELDKAIANLSVGQGYEPSQIVVSKLTSLALDSKTQQLQQRVTLKAIEKGLRDDGESLGSWQVGKILRDQGFVVKTIGGNRYVLVDKAHLIDVATRLGIDDDLLKQMTP